VLHPRRQEGNSGLMERLDKLKELKRSEEGSGTKGRKEERITEV
jgi:hypothetical protein